MSIATNVLMEIINEAKLAKKYLEKGYFSKTKELFDNISLLENKELEFLKKEIGSSKIINHCSIILDHLKTYDLKKEYFEKRKTELNNILDKIIEIETFDLKYLHDESKGLEKTILKQIDPYIRELSDEISKLFLLKKQLFLVKENYL